MGAGCCKHEEVNPDGTLKDPQTKEQVKEDPKELRRYALTADWGQMRMLLRRMPLKQICSGATKDEGADEETGNTALHFSVSINHLRGVKKLLRYGIPPGVRNRAGKTPLHLAVETGKLKAARILLGKAMAHRAAAKGTKPPYLINVKDNEGVSPLLAVVAAGRLKLVREVLALCRELDVGIDFDTKDSQGNSMLLYAAKWGWFDELEAWLDSVVSPRKLLNLQNKQGETVLGHVLMFNASGLLGRQRAAALLRKMLELDAVVVLPAFQEKVPLLNLAAAADDKTVYDMLVSAGADPLRCRDALGRTPLHYAAAKGAKVLAEILLDAGLKAYALDGQGNTPLHLASMRGHEDVVSLLLDKADDKIKALLTPNKAGLSAYHLALKSGPDDRAQSNSLSLIELLGEQFTAPVLGRRKAVVDTPLLLATQGHQDRVVKALLQKGCSPNEANARGELPLARVLSSATAVTYDNDCAIFDQLIAGGATLSGASETAHPMLAICKNNLSKFAEKAVAVLTERCGPLDWNKRDDRGYTPLALAAFHDNAWLVRYLVDEVGVNPNDANQRTVATEVEQVGTTGVLCFAKPLTVPGTVENQTPLMCAAKGASLTAVQLLLNRGADVNAVDGLGRSALQHAMHLDKAVSLKVAAALLQMGARPERGTQVRSDDGTLVWKSCVDLVGESWAHRAVRYGFSAFLGLWAACGGSLELLATTADDADDMPGAELKVEEKADFLDVVPRRVHNLLEGGDEELLDDYNGADSEEPPQDEEEEEGGQEGTAAAADAEATTEAGAVAEGVERPRRGGGGGSDSGSEDDCGEDEELAELIARGQVESHYAGPTPRMLLRWRRRGPQWWNEFWVDKDSLPDVDLEGDPTWEDKYNLCEEGDEWIDEEDVEDEIWEAIREEQRMAANELRRRKELQQLQQEQQQQEEEQQGLGSEGAEGSAQRCSRSGSGSGSARSSSSSVGAGSGGEGGGEGEEVEAEVGDAQSLLHRFGSGLAHRLFRHRLPKAAVPEVNVDADEGTFAAGSPSKWLRRKPSASATSAQQPAAAAPDAADNWTTSDRPGASSGRPVAEGSETDSFGSRRRPSRKLYQSQADDLQIGDVEDDADDIAKDAPAAPSRSSSRSTPQSQSQSQGGLSRVQSTTLPQSQPQSQGGLSRVQSTSQPQSLVLSQPQTSMRDSKSRGELHVRLSGEAAGDDDGSRESRGEERTALLNRGSLRSDAPAGAGKATVDRARSSKRLSGLVSREPSQAVSERSRVYRSGSVASVTGQLVSGRKAERLYANEPYYQPDSLYNGLPRYMNVETHELPDEQYDKMVAAFEARLGSYDIRDEKLVEGPELRARNMGWYHKSMSPTEYPLKVGKWKSFLRLSKKAIEEAKLRRPRKPGEKPKIRSKKAWFGLPNLPSRPELALTTPLVYAVRLGRVSCVKELLKYSGALTNMPDAHGVTPLSYAMFMLARDRNNKAVQQIVDLLLDARPLADTATVWRLIVLPRLNRELAELEAEAKQLGGPDNMPRRKRKALFEKRETVSFLRDCYTPQHFPSVMEPVVLAALLNDVGRMTVLVRHCGANLNNAWVWLPDIPAYFKGLWEKQLARCNSRCTALHVAICQKKFDTVRALLDLGADPNLSGSEFTGNVKRDLARQARLYQDKAKETARMKEAGAKYNTYAKLWQDTRSGLKEMFYSTKRFLASIEIPGLTRPHPWLSPLHLACRFGLPEITFLLVQRGAAANGGPAAAAAPKSPLEEALLYARENAQAYGTTSERFNYRYIMEQSRLDVNDMNRLAVEAARKLQKAELAEKVAAVRVKAEMLSAQSPKDKKGNPTKKPEDFLKQANKVIGVGGSLALFDPEHLKDLPIPSMNLIALADAGMKLIKDAMALMDPMKAAIKAVMLAAKILIKILLSMMRRPIALYDPALACAHVLLYFRAPVNVNEKQTGILVRDILDNGNGLSDADKRTSYYRWLGIEPEQVNDPAWVESVINKIAILKSNVDYGYMKLDLTTSAKDHQRYKKKFMAQVQNAVLQHGCAAVMPQYLMRVIEEGSPDGNVAGDKAKAAAVLDSWLEAYIKTRMERREALVKQYTAQPAHLRDDWVNRRNFGVVPTKPTRDEVARELLPQWLQNAPPVPEGNGAVPAQQPGIPAGWGPEVYRTVPEKAEQVKRFLIARFIQYDPQTRQPVEYKEPPLGPDVWTQMLEGNPKEIAFIWPSIDEEELKAVRPTITDVSDADVCSAIVRAYNAMSAKRAEEQSKRLQAASAARAQVAGERFRQQLESRAQARAQLIAANLEISREARMFDEAPLFKAAVEDPMWEAAAKKLGGGVVAAAVAARLRAAQARGEIPAIGDPLEFVKSLGQRALDQASEELLAKMEEQLGGSLGIQLRKDLMAMTSKDTEGGGQAGAQGAGAGPGQPEQRKSLDTVMDEVEAEAMDLADDLRDPESYLEMAKSQYGEQVAAMLKALQDACEEGKMPVPEPDALAQDLAQAIRDMGPDAIVSVWESKTGLPLPEVVKREVEKGAKQFADRVMEKYEQGGISAAIGACTLIAAGVAVAVGTGIADGLEARAGELLGSAQQAVDTATEVMQGNLEALADMSLEDALALPMPKKARDAMAPVAQAVKEANQALESLASTSRQLQESVCALTGEATAALESLSSQLADTFKKVSDTLNGEVEAATDQLMAGFELMMEVDFQALAEALDDAREVLVLILDMLHLDEIV